MPRASLEDPVSVFGKLPVRGDFITRRFSRPCVTAWDGWLQEAIAASHDALAELVQPPTRPVVHRSLDTPSLGLSL